MRKIKIDATSKSCMHKQVYMDILKYNEHNKNRLQKHLETLILDKKEEVFVVFLALVVEDYVLLEDIVRSGFAMSSADQDNIRKNIIIQHVNKLL